MRRIMLLVAAALPASAAAEVKSSSAVGFEVEAKAIVPAAPARAYAALGRVGNWWNAAHSYSGDAANMTMDARPGGCFCETIPADRGAVEHMRVVLAWPGKMLRLQGGLGPLQGEGAVGSLTWALKAVPGGTEITQAYVVGGYVRGGADKMAPLVDQVLTEQLQRLARHLGGADADRPD